MASGKTHDKIAYITSPIAFAVVHILFESFSLSIFSIFIYILASLMFCSDLDLPSREYRRWGPFKFIWHPYQKAFKHRSSATHSVVFANVIRLLYLSIWVYGLVFVLALILKGEVYSAVDYYGEIFIFIANNQRFCAVVFICLCLASLAHLIADLTSTKVKKMKHKKDNLFNLGKKKKVVKKTSNKISNNIIFWNNK